jgi:hypothetical protein
MEVARRLLVKICLRHNLGSVLARQDIFEEAVAQAYLILVETARRFESRHQRSNFFRFFWKRLQGGILMWFHEYTWQPRHKPIEYIRPRTFFYSSTWLTNFPDRELEDTDDLERLKRLSPLDRKVLQRTFRMGVRVPCTGHGRLFRSSASERRRLSNGTRINPNGTIARKRRDREWVCDRSDKMKFLTEQDRILLRRYFGLDAYQPRSSLQIAREDSISQGLAMKRIRRAMESLKK